MLNDTTRLLGLAGVAVVAVEDGGEDGPVVHLVTHDARARACPQCAVTAVRVKEWVTTRPRDLEICGRRSRLRWRKRRWRCDEPTCPRGSFTEEVAQIPARSRLACRLRQAAGAAVCDGGRTIVQSARDHALSWPVVAAAFSAHANQVLPERSEPVRVLSTFDVLAGSCRQVVAG